MLITLIKEPAVDILICTDGSDSSIQSAELVSKLEFPAASHIVILGVSESQSDVDKLTDAMDEINQRIGAKYSLDQKIRYGNPTEEILTEALDGSYDLVAVGGGGKQMGILHVQLGSTTSKLARKLHTHFLVARNIPRQIKKILVCTGPDMQASETIKLGGEWISNLSAEIGLLHVTPSANKTLRATRNHRSMDKLLEQAYQELRDAGVKSEIVTHLRYGLIVDEVLKELDEGEYELLVIGAHYQPGQDRWQEVLLDDVTDQLLNRANCSVLII